MKCPTCETAGQTSQVRMGPKRHIDARADQFWDEAGEFHNHDASQAITPISCTNGHTWQHVGVRPCPTCGVVVPA